jgi:hypothetical protein
MTIFAAIASLLVLLLAPLLALIGRIDSSGLGV